MKRFHLGTYRYPKGVADTVVFLGLKSPP